MRTVRSFSLILAIAFFSACTGYNSTDIEDRNAGNERIYGDVGGPARQLAQEYPADPEAGVVANEIRDMWWPEKGHQPMDNIDLEAMMEDEGKYDDENMDKSTISIDTANNTENPDHETAGAEGRREEVGNSNKQVD